MKSRLYSANYTQENNKRSNINIISSLNTNNKVPNLPFIRSENRKPSSVSRSSKISKYDKRNFNLDNKSIRLDESFNNISTVENKVVEKRFTQFKPSVFARNLLNSIIPSNKEKKKRVDRFNNIHSKTVINDTLGNINTSSNYKIDEEEEFFICKTDEGTHCHTHANKSPQNYYLKTDCSHVDNDDKFINHFLTPINKFIAKDFKINNDLIKKESYLKTISRIKLKAPKQLNRFNIYGM